MRSDQNPFPVSDPDRHEIWEMLVSRDIDAFIAQDWDRHARDFLADEFLGIDACRSADPDQWRLSFPSLEAYSADWLRFSRESAAVEWAEDLRLAHFRSSRLDRVEIAGDRALVHKKFDGTIRRRDGRVDTLRWQTLYLCAKRGGRWWISGLLGYLPPASYFATPNSGERKRVPASLSHATAGPYSPVVAVRPGEIVVISGQVAVERDGSVSVEGFDAQTERTLANCRSQLEAAGCTLADVFKATVYLADLSRWPRFNEIYARFMPRPLPARTAVGVSLLAPFEVEVEMWAVRP